MISSIDESSIVELSDYDIDHVTGGLDISLIDAGLTALGAGAAVGYAIGYKGGSDRAKRDNSDNSGGGGSVS